MRPFVLRFAIIHAATLPLACDPAEDVSLDERQRPFARVPAAPVPSTAPTEDFHSGIYLPINDRELASVDGIRVVAHGNAAFSFAAPEMDATTNEDHEIDSFDATLDLRTALSLEISVEAAGRFSEEIDLALVPLPPFRVGAIDVLPYAYATVKLRGSASASARLGFVAPFETSLDFSLESGEPLIQRSNGPRPSLQLGRPELAGSFDVTATLDVGLVLLASIDGVAVGGPALSTELGFALSGSRQRASWSADAALRLAGGWTFPDPLTTLPVLPPTSEISLASVPWHLGDGVLPTQQTPVRWSRTYDLGDRVLAAAATQRDGNVVLLGNSSNEDWPWLAELDPAGIPRWQYGRPSSSGRLAARTVISTSDGELLAAGNSRLERFDALGQALWAYNLVTPDAANVVLNASVPTEAGGAILGGYVVHTDGPDVQRAFVAEVDALGAVLWQSEVDLGLGSTDPDIQALTLTSTGEILAAGTLAYLDSTFASWSGFVMRLDPTGQAIGAQVLGGPGEERLYAIARLSDDSYVVGGYAAREDAASRAARVGNWAWLAAFDAEDHLRWTATYGGDNRDPYAHVTSLAALPDRALLVSAGPGHPDYTHDAWLFEIDTVVGMPRWFKSYAGPGDDTLETVLPMPDGLLAFGDTTSIADPDPDSARDLWVVRSGVEGHVHFTADSGMVTTNDSAHWSRSSHVAMPLAPENVVASVTPEPGVLELSPAAAVILSLTE